MVLHCFRLWIWGKLCITMSFSRYYCSTFGRDIKCHWNSAHTYSLASLKGKGKKRKCVVKLFLRSEWYYFAACVSMARFSVSSAHVRQCARLMEIDTTGHLMGSCLIILVHAKCTWSRWAFSNRSRYSPISYSYKSVLLLTTNVWSRVLELIRCNDDCDSRECWLLWEWRDLQEISPHLLGTLLHCVWWWHRQTCEWAFLFLYKTLNYNYTIK